MSREENAGAQGVAPDEYIVDLGESLMALRDLDSAKRFPLFVGADVARSPRGAAHQCENGVGDGKPIVLTTYGVLGLGNFSDYPLAMDAWDCGSGRLEYPAQISETTFRRLKDAGFLAAQAGELDKAEYCFRRLTNSFPRYGESHLNLASVYVDRIARSGAGPDDPRIRPWIRQAELHLRQAISGEPPAPPIAKLTLGRLYANTGRPAEARPLLEAVAQEPSLTPTQRAEALALVKMIAQ